MKARRGLYWLALLGLIGAFAAVTWMRGALEQDADSSSGAEQRPAFTLPDLSGDARSVAEWDGEVLVLNFWATWCPPCVEEIPELVAVQEQLGDRGLQIVGVAVDEPEEIRPFLERVPVNYPILHGVADSMSVLDAYGNARGTLPYTVIIDRTGEIRHRVPRAVDAAELEALVRPLLRREAG